MDTGDSLQSTRAQHPGFVFNAWIRNWDVQMPIGLLKQVEVTLCFDRPADLGETKSSGIKLG